MFVVSVILSNVFEAVGFALGGGVFFIIAVMLCPAALLVGLIGGEYRSRSRGEGITMHRRRRR